MRRVFVAGIASLSFLIARSSLAAEDPEKLFAEGNALLDQGKPQEALVKLEAAEKLDPGVGTEFNIAVCHEKLGHLGTAWRMFESVQRLAHAAGKKTREDAATKKLEELKPQLPYFTITSRDPGEVIVKVDGAIVSKDAWSFYPVDPGTHHVDATAATKKPWSADVAAPANGQHAEVSVPVLQTVEGKTITVTKQTTNTRRTIGYVVGGVGVVALIGAGVTGGILLSDKSSADKDCATPPNNRCVNADGTPNKEGADAVSQGRTLIPINAIAWGVGAVGIGVGAFLIFTGNKKDETSTPKVGSITPSFSFLPGGGYLGISTPL